VKALLLVGGFGTRLRPLTYTRPKHLLPIANRPHIEHVFDLLRRHGIHEVVLLTSYLGDEFAPMVAAAKERGMAVDVAHEPEPLGTAGGIRNASHLVTGTFLVFNADVLTAADLGAVVEFHNARRALTTIVLTPVEDPSAYGVVPTSADGRVLDFIEKPPRSEAPTNLINAGIYVMEPEVLERIPADKPYSAERELFPGLVAGGERVFATGTHAYWMDIGTPRKFLQANYDALEGAFPTDAVGAGAGAVLADAVVAAPGARIAASARVSCSCLGRDVVIEDGAAVERSVLFGGAVVGNNATVVESIVGEGAVIATGVSVVGQTVADGSKIQTTQ
jgi:NDP-sugar pyrophosphorylase family protein